MLYGKRDYYCPSCGTHEDIATNHTGWVSHRCKICHNTTMFCAEHDMSNMPYRTAKIIFYRFDVNDYRPNHEGAIRDYQGIENTLHNLGYSKVSFEHKFTAESRNMHLYMSALEKHVGEEIKVYEKDWPKGLYLTNIGQLHNWEEPLYPNKGIKAGYYLLFD